MVLPVDDHLRIDLANEHILEVRLKDTLDVVALLLWCGIAYARSVVREVDIACE